MTTRLVHAVAVVDDASALTAAAERTALAAQTAAAGDDADAQSSCVLPTLACRASAWRRTASAASQSQPQRQQPRASALDRLASRSTTHSTTAPWLASRAACQTDRRRRCFGQSAAAAAAAAAVAAVAQLVVATMCVVDATVRARESWHLRRR